MTKLERSFDVEGAPEIDLSIPAGDIVLRERQGSTVEVVLSGSDRALEGIEIEQYGRSVVVRHRGSRKRLILRHTDVTVEMPPNGQARVKTASGDVKVSVPLAECDIRVAAGEVRVATVSGSCNVRSASGEVIIDHAGEVRVVAASGDIRIDGVATDVDASTASGSIAVGSFGENAVLKSASGDVTVDRFDGVDLNAKSLSGHIRIGIPAGLEIEANLQSMSGSVRNELSPAGASPRKRVHLYAKTLSGDITLRDA